MVRATIGIFTQLPLLGLALYFGYDQGVLSRELLSPWYFGLGVIAGHGIFCVSLIVTPLSFSGGAGEGEGDGAFGQGGGFREVSRSISAARPYFFDLVSPVRLVVDAPVVLSRFVAVSVSEELVWRCGAQWIFVGLTGNAGVGIVLTAVGFSIVHRHFFKNEVIVSSEFLAFSLLLGGLYYWTGSLILVIVIHAVRDIEIVYHEYCEKVEEMGSDVAALEAIETEYSQKSRMAV